MWVNTSHKTSFFKKAALKAATAIRAISSNAITVKKTLATLALICAGISSGAQVNHHSEPIHETHNQLNKQTMDNKEILRTANEAIAKGDYERYLSFCADNSEWRFEGEQRLVGKDAIRQYMKRTYLTPPVFTTDKTIAGEDYVIAMGTITLPDTQGRPVSYSYCDVWRFTDGKMVALNAYVVEDKMK